MERIVGTPSRRAAELLPLGSRRTRALAQSLVTMLATLHRVDPLAVGLSDFGRPDGYLSRRVVRWKKQMDASHFRELPAAAELHRRLQSAALAVEGPGATAGIVHGDHRLDNLLVAGPRRAVRLRGMSGRPASRRSSIRKASRGTPAAGS